MEENARISALEAEREARLAARPEGHEAFGEWLDSVLEIDERLAALKEIRREGPLTPPPEGGQDLRHVKRADRAPKRRPARLVDSNGLTRRDRAVYAYIRRKAKGREIVEISNQELAYGTGYKRRSIQLATAALHCAGKALKQERRVSPTRSLPNRFTLPENRRFYDNDRRRSQGRKKYAQNPHKDSTPQVTSHHNAAASQQCNPFQGKKGGGARRPLPRRSAASTDAVRLSPSEVGSLVRGLRRLEEPECEDLAPTCPPERVKAAIEAVRRREFPAYPDGLWRHYLARHGSKAYFAVLETVGTHRGLIPREGDRSALNDPAAYLSGILRKPGEECRPHDTVAVWLAISERESPLPSSVDGGESPPPAGVAPRRRLEPSPVERQEWQNRRELRGQVLAELERQVGAKEVAQWLDPLDVARVTSDSVTMTAPSRFIRDYVRGQYAWQLTRAWAALLGRSVAVRVVVGNGDRTR